MNTLTLDDFVVGPGSTRSKIAQNINHANTWVTIPANAPAVEVPQNVSFIDGAKLGVSIPELVIYLVGLTAKKGKHTEGIGILPVPDSAPIAVATKRLNVGNLDYVIRAIRPKDTFRNAVPDRHFHLDASTRIKPPYQYDTGLSRIVGTSCFFYEHGSPRVLPGCATTVFSTGNADPENNSLYNQPNINPGTFTAPPDAFALFDPWTTTHSGPGLVDYLASTGTWPDGAAQAWSNGDLSVYRVLFGGRRYA